MSCPYDALLLVSFGGPEKPDDVIPFLENVTRGKSVPPQRLLEVARRYEPFGGESPINEQNRALLAALVEELNTHGPYLVVYWGNRNWHPLLADTLGQMADDGIGRALALVTSAFGSYSSCRQYLEDIDHARQEVGPNAPRVDKLRLFYNHPGFIESMADRVDAALDEIPEKRRANARIVYSAHSLPLAMAENCDYQRQLREACRLVSDRLGHADWDLVYQSRGGPPPPSAEQPMPWLEPDVCDYLNRLGQSGEVGDVVIVPIGFLVEHMEIVCDLDVEARAVCEQFGLNMVRAPVIGCHPRFVRMVRELICERIDDNPTRLALGTHGPSPDVCPPDCCLSRKRDQV